MLSGKYVKSFSNLRLISKVFIINYQIETIKLIDENFYTQQFHFSQFSVKSNSKFCQTSNKNFKN